MLHPIRALSAVLPALVRAGLGRRTTGIVLALLLELLLLLALLTLGQSKPQFKEADTGLTTFNVGPEAKPEADEAPAEASARPLQQPKAQPKPRPPEEPQPEVVLPSLIPVSPDLMARMDISKIAPRPKPQTGPSKPKMGPSDNGAYGDTPLMSGTGPNGEPLYAAAWYREPYDNELDGYLSAANGPGWGLIACRTVPDFRVADCAIVDEYPRGSNIARSVLEASWQFRVRPPRRGGRAMIGEWVGIRIDYGIKRRPY